MRTVDVSVVTQNIKEMCIEANHFLTEDMKCALDKAVTAEKSPLGKQVLEQLEENLQIAGEDMIPICQDTGMAVVFMEPSICHISSHLSMPYLLRSHPDEILKML